MKSNPRINSQTYVTVVRGSVFRPTCKELSKLEVSAVRSSIGVSAISSVHESTTGKVRVPTSQEQEGPTSYDKLKKDYEFVPRLAQCYWGLRMTLHDFIKLERIEHEKVKMSLLQTLKALTVEFAKGTGEQFLKLHTNMLVSRSVLDQEECPKADLPLFFGILKRKIQLRLTRARQGDVTCRSFFYTLQMTKKVWLEMPIATKEKALAKHKAALSSVKELSEDAVYWINKAVDLVVPPGTKYVSGNICPTYSACAENIRSNGGNRYLVVGGDIFSDSPVDSLDKNTVIPFVPRLLTDRKSVV